MNCSSLIVPSASVANYMQDMVRMKHGSFSLSKCPPLRWPGVTIMQHHRADSHPLYPLQPWDEWSFPDTAHRMTLNQLPAFCQVSTTSESGKVNWSELFRQYICHEMCHIISKFSFLKSKSGVCSSVTNRSPEQECESCTLDWSLSFGDKASTSWISRDLYKVKNVQGERQYWWERELGEFYQVERERWQR